MIPGTGPLTVKFTSMNTPCDTPFRIAVVGCGPRGLYCLEELASMFRIRRPDRPVEVLVFEVSTYPGAGSIYDPDQPDYLRMNYAAKHINAWRNRSRRVSTRLDFVTWANRQRTYNVAPEDYVSRSLVGRYLADAYTQVSKTLAGTPGIGFCQLRVRVDRVEKDTRGWKIIAKNCAWHTDEVLLTVGHEGWRPSSFVGTGPESENTTRYAFPPAEKLTRANVPVGAHVLINGFGLTAIDTVLGLTEGRGGSFLSTGNRLTYVPSGREPQLIRLQSRTGRPMLAKPIDSAMQLPALEAIWSAGRSSLLGMERPITGTRASQELWKCVVHSAAEALSLCRGVTSEPAEVAKQIMSWFCRWKASTPNAKEISETLIASVKVANGLLPPDEPWALGQAWRCLYPALVEIVSHGGLTFEAWQVWKPIAVEMERIAFGPPAENVSRLLALEEANILCFGHSLKESDDSVEAPTSELHRVIQLSAVSAQPNEYSKDGPIAHLIETGILRRLHGTLGIEVDVAGEPAHQGTDSSGLSVLGRITEGCILGNDTLSRKLHNHPERWAMKVAARFRHLSTGERYVS